MGSRNSTKDYENRAACAIFISLLSCLVMIIVLQNSTPVSAAAAGGGGAGFVKSAYWSSDSGLPLENINSTLFTHLFCAFADLNSTTYHVIVSPSNHPSFSNFTRVLQQSNPSLKTLLSIGGGNVNKTTFALMATTPQSRKAFIHSSIKVARQYNFHGLDLDWEYPQVAQDMDNLGLLLEEWRAAVNAESRSSGRARLLLTLAGYYSYDIRFLAYDPPRSAQYPAKSIANSLDWVNVMAYDFYQPTWHNFTEAHAALFDLTNRNFSGSYGIQQWIKAGIPAHRLVLGFPFYGYAWKLVSPAQYHGLLAPADGPAAVGSTDGSILYSQIREFLAKHGDTTTKRVYNSSVGVNYCYEIEGTTWIGYDDVETISAKVSYAKRKGLLGYVAWHVGGDDTNFTLSKTAATQ